MLEKDIERKAVQEARNAGWLSYKFVSPNYRSVPDRIFVKDGTAVFIEFKRQGGKLTGGQAREIQKLREAGMNVFVCWSVQEALDALRGVV